MSLCLRLNYSGKKRRGAGGGRSEGYRDEDISGRGRQKKRTRESWVRK